VARGLDHVAHAVRDLDAAAALYARMGFLVGARNRHAPNWGTQNYIVQLPGFFVELLAMGDTRAIEPHAADFFSFGAFNRDFLSRDEGLSMLVLEGRDSAAEAAEFDGAGIGRFRTYTFERDAKRPDGAPTKVAFSLAFAGDAKAPDIGFFACRQHSPENFWIPAFQQHANTTIGISRVILVAAAPADHAHFVSAFTGAGEPTAVGSGIVVKTPRGEIAVMEPAAFVRQFGVRPPDIGGGARLAALCFAVRDLAAAGAALMAGKVDFAEQSQKLVVGPHVAFGATLVLESAG
jgi:hypothetical protein